MPSKKVYFLGSSFREDWEKGQREGMSQELEKKMLAMGKCDVVLMLQFPEMQETETSRNLDIT